jgi:VWFA-related protein
MGSWLSLRRDGELRSGQELVNSAPADHISNKGHCSFLHRFDALRAENAVFGVAGLLLPWRPTMGWVRMSSLALLVALAAPAAVWLAPAQSARADTTLEEQVSVGYVYVPIVVRSRSGYVRDLKRKDFRLLVDGQPAAFDTFETGATAPASIVVLQDLSGSMANGGKLDASRQAVRYLVGQSRPGDELALAWFAGDILEMDVPFTSDATALLGAVEAWKAYGTTALQDAVAWLPRIATSRGGVKRAALLITDGLDNASTMNADQARELVRESELPVYVLGLGSGRASDRVDDEQVYRFADMLSMLATLSGGRYHPLKGPEELEPICAKILEDLRHQYVLGFRVGGPGPARDHRLQVEIAGRGKRALAFRRGYHGLDPEAASTPAQAR